jgi:hypothetical protein
MRGYLTLPSSTMLFFVGGKIKVRLLEATSKEEAV